MCARTSHRLCMVHQRYNTRVPRHQACYGHTEGAAGLAGALLALCVTTSSGAPGVQHLRSVNPYVAAALVEWRSHGDSAAPIVPRQSAAAAASPSGALAGAHACRDNACTNANRTHPMPGRAAALVA